MNQVNQMSRCARTVQQRMYLVAALVVLLWPARMAWAEGQIFVPNYNGDRVTVYGRKAAGDVAPSTTILTGSFSAPHNVAIHHGAGELFVSNNLAYTVSVYDLATGVLKRTISSPSIIRPTGLAIDELNGEIYVANDYGNSVAVFDALAAGDATPKRVIQSAYYLSGPSGIALDLANDELVVASQGFNAILTFGRRASGDVSPKRIIWGGATLLNLPQGVSIDVMNNEILVANSAYQTPNGGAILVFPRTAGSFPEGPWDPAPLRQIAGSNSGICNPMSVALDRITNELIVANSNAGAGTCAQSVTTYARATNGNVAPTRTLSGALTELLSPESAAITSGSSVNLKAMALKSSVTVGAGLTAAIGYTITMTANGGPVLNASLADQLPGGLSWSLGGTHASACTVSLSNVLTCNFGNIAKGDARQIQVGATATVANCPGIVNQAFAAFDDGTAYAATARSSAATISIKCK